MAWRIFIGIKQTQAKQRDLGTILPHDEDQNNPSGASFNVLSIKTNVFNSTGLRD